ARCMQNCMQAGTSSPASLPAASTPEPGDDAGSPSDARSDGGSGAPQQEMTMHQFNCQCSQCTRATPGFAVMPFAANIAKREYETYEDESQYEGSYEGEGEY